MDSRAIVYPWTPPLSVRPPLKKKTSDQNPYEYRRSVSSLWSRDIEGYAKFAGTGHEQRLFDILGRLDWTTSEPEMAPLCAELHTVVQAMTKSASDKTVTSDRGDVPISWLRHHVARR